MRPSSLREPAGASIHRPRGAVVAVAIAVALFLLTGVAWCAGAVHADRLELQFTLWSDASGGFDASAVLAFPSASACATGEAGPAGELYAELRNLQGASIPASSQRRVARGTLLEVGGPAFFPSAATLRQGDQPVLEFTRRPDGGFDCRLLRVLGVPLADLPQRLRHAEESFARGRLRVAVKLPGTILSTSATKFDARTFGFEIAGTAVVAARSPLPAEVKASCGPPLPEAEAELAAARPVQAEAACKAHLRELGKRIDAWTNDHGGMQGPAASLQAALVAPDPDHPAVVRLPDEESLFHCPAAGAPPDPDRLRADCAAASGYAETRVRLSHRLSGLAPILWDKQPHPDGRRNVLCYDGHVETLDETRFQNLLAKYQANEAPAK